MLYCPGMDGQLQVSNWIESARRRGQVPFLLTVLDVIEPIAPALAQGLLVAQPLASFWPGAAGVRDWPTYWKSGRHSGLRQQLLTTRWSERIGRDDAAGVQPAFCDGDGGAGVYGAVLAARRGKRRVMRQIAGFAQLPKWTGQAIESKRPLHLSFGSAGIGGDNTAVALAEAEFFHHIIEGASASDISPIVSMSSPATIRWRRIRCGGAWQGGDYLSRVHWYPQGQALAGVCRVGDCHDAG